jgi:hypothetical protein
MHHAPCNVRHATHCTHHAPCNVSYAPCTMQRITCTMHLAPLPSPSQLRVVQSGLSVQEGRQDLPRTPRRRNYRDRDSGRIASGSGRHHNPSRSRSPARRNPNNPGHQRSPPPYQSPSKYPSFQPSTAFQGQPVCAICLATDPHDSRKCRSETLWDGSKARCRKNDEGRLVTPAGTTLCSDWNSRRGCSSSTHEQRHECSGCGNKDHGAQRCPRAQKKPSAHSL